MMRFVDLGKQLGIDEEWPREFAFYNTVSSEFLNFGGAETWESWKDFEEYFRESIRSEDEADDAEEMLERLKSLCPDWVFETQSIDAG